MVGFLNGVGSISSIRAEMNSALVDAYVALCQDNMGAYKSAIKYVNESFSLFDSARDRDIIDVVNTERDILHVLENTAPNLRVNKYLECRTEYALKHNTGF
ncbi:hypothetical protein GQ473_04860 [archaeon]|nr:hypothetical protein [archaeon]